MQNKTSFEKSTPYRKIPYKTFLHEKSYLTDNLILILLFWQVMKFKRLTSFKSLKNIWDKVFKKGTSKICGRQTLKKFEGAWSAMITLGKVLLAHLNIDFLLNRFKLLANQIVGNTDVLVLSKTKLDELF